MGIFKQAAIVVAANFLVLAFHQPALAAYALRQIADNLTGGQDAMYTGISGTLVRTYWVHIPSGYDNTRAYPLMIVYHGQNGTGSQMQKQSDFHLAADQHGFLVAFPDAFNGSWQPTGRNNDIDFTKSMTADIETHYKVDTTRVYVSGLSEGGNFAQILGCVMADWFAGFGNVAGALNDTVASQCFPSRPLSAIFFHGTADPVVPYDGGVAYSGATVYSARQTAQFWANQEACQPSPSSTDFADTLNDGSSVIDTLDSWSGCTTPTSVSLYTIGNGGHTWPGTTDASSSFSTNNPGPASTQVNASDIIWRVLSGTE